MGEARLPNLLLGLLILLVFGADTTLLNHFFIEHLYIGDRKTLWVVLDQSFTPRWIHVTCLSLKLDVPGHHFI